MSYRQSYMKHEINILGIHFTRYVSPCVFFFVISMNSSRMSGIHLLKSQIEYRPRSLVMLIFGFNYALPSNQPPALSLSLCLTHNPTQCLVGGAAVLCQAVCLFFCLNVTKFSKQLDRLHCNVSNCRNTSQPACVYCPQFLLD